MIHDSCKYFNRSFRRTRSDIERSFGILKFSYSAVGSSRFRSRRHHSPLVMNLCAALFNRRKMIFNDMRQNLNIN